MGLSVIRKAASGNLHLMPILLVLIQAPCYCLLFKDVKVYERFSGLLNHLFMDSLILLLMIFFLNRKWYFLNTVLFSGLCICWVINAYIIIWDISLVNYLYWIISIAYVIYISALTYTITTTNFNFKP